MEPLSGRWLLWLLVFRLMFMSGVLKLAMAVELVEQHRLGAPEPGGLVRTVCRSGSTGCPPYDVHH